MVFLPTRMGGRPKAGSAGLGTVLTLGLGARLGVLALLPAGAQSADASAWEQVAGTLRSGQNPYSETALLNWPPLWMMAISLLDHTGKALGVSFQHVLVGALLLADLSAMTLAWLLIHRLWPEARAARWVAVGLALNPVAILLCCQHRNFDVLVALSVLAAVLALVRFHRTAASEDWLAGCAWLGLGILSKTVPLLLAPLLVPGARRLGARMHALGAVLFLGPAALGLGVLEALAPEGVQRNVFAYRSASGYYGLTGLLHVAGWARGEAALARSAAPFFLLSVAGLCLWLLGGPPPPPRATTLGAAVLLLAVPVLGPGYGPQYVGWVLPLLTVLAASRERRLLPAIAAFALVLAGTDLIEYALLPSHGAWALRRPHADVLDRWSGAVQTQSGQTWLRLPLYLASLVLLVVMARVWARWLSPAGESDTDPRPLAPGPDAT